jgi:hypothetical protein
MPANRIRGWSIAIAAAIGMAAVSVNTIDTAAVQSVVEHAEPPTKGVLPNRDESPVSETDFRLSDHQQLRRIFLGR